MEVLVFLTFNHYDFDIFRRGCIVDVVTERRKRKRKLHHTFCFEMCQKWKSSYLVFIMAGFFFPLYFKSFYNVFNWNANGAASCESIWAFNWATIGRHLQLAAVILVGWRCSDKKHVGIAAILGWYIGQWLTLPIRIIWICGKLWVKWPQPWESLEHLRDSFTR